MLSKDILVVEDDEYIANMLNALLTNNGYSVTNAYSGSEALLVLSSKKIDLILLDLMLPGLSGDEVLAHVKDIPVIVLSAKNDSDSKVRLLLGGAKDYITKPFDTKELLARIMVAFRASPVSSSLKFEDIELDTKNFTVNVCGNPIHLTKTEYAILKTLIINSNQVVTKSVLLDKISEDTPDCTENSLKIHMSNLRKKLRVDCIESVWGVGFKMKKY